MPDPRVFRTSG